jgi:hypothetical protein
MARIGVGTLMRLVALLLMLRAAWLRIPAGSGGPWADMDMLLVCLLPYHQPITVRTDGLPAGSANDVLLSELPLFVGWNVTSRKQRWAGQAAGVSHDSE